MPIYRLGPYEVAETPLEKLDQLVEAGAVTPAVGGFSTFPFLEVKRGALKRFLNERDDES